MDRENCESACRCCNLMESCGGYAIANCDCHFEKSSEVRFCLKSGEKVIGGSDINGQD